MPKPEETYLLADIGGTNTRIGLSDGTVMRADTIKRFENARFAGFDAVLDAYLSGAEQNIDGCCVALAGPVEGDSGHLTNRDWTIDKAMLSARTGTNNAAILNDLVAQGYALASLDPASLTPILGDTAQRAPGSKLVIGIGTGFNIAAVHESERGHFVIASESGHMTLPVRQADEQALAARIVAEQGFASVEDVVSGQGLAETDRRLRGTQEARDGSAVISAAIAGDADAQNALGLVCRLLGTVAGDLALSHLPHGGIYLIGGVARALAPLLMEQGFADAFHDKGRFSDYMKRFPIYLVQDDYAALSGCAAYLSSSSNRL